MSSPLVFLLWCIIFGVHATNDSIPPCISHLHKRSQETRNPVCTHNDTYCGEWTDKKWNPVGCKYREFSGEDARKCLGNRTIGCIGDSQMRHLCNGLVYILYDMTIEDEFVDPTLNHNLFDYVSGDMFENVDKVMFPDTYRAVAPKKFIQEFNDYTWQVQIWNIFNQTLTNRHIHEMFENKYLNANKLPSAVNITKLKPIDFALWNNGFHDIKQFSTEPYGENFYNFFVKQYIALKDTAKYPVVWTSMNTECMEKKRFYASQYQYQVKLVDEANYYTHKRMKEERLPYFDATSVLRTTEEQKCIASHDGVHVNIWVAITTAQMLLNHLCDEDNNWVGGVESFK